VLWNNSVAARLLHIVLLLAATLSTDACHCCGSALRLAVPFVLFACRYTVCFCAEDGSGNQQASPACISVTMTADASPPVFVSSTPTVSSETDSSVSLVLETDETCTAFYVLLPADASDTTTPTLADIRAGTDGTGAAAVSSGSVVIAAGAPSTITALGLTAATSFKWHLFAEDSESPPNTQASATIVNTVTGADVTPPSWESGYPRVQFLTDSSFQLQALLNEPGSVSWVVLLSSSASPTTSQVAVGTDGEGQPPVGAGTVTCIGPSSPCVANVTGLTAATPYTVYLVARDDEPTPNVVSATSFVSVVTGADVTPPTLVTTSVSGVTDTQATLAVKTSEAGRWWAVLALPSVPTPTALQVTEGKDGSGQPAVASVTVVASEAEATTATLTGAAASTEYSMCVLLLLLLLRGQTWGGTMQGWVAPCCDVCGEAYSRMRCCCMGVGGACGVCAVTSWRRMTNRLPTSWRLPQPSLSPLRPMRHRRHGWVRHRCYLR